MILASFIIAVFIKPTLQYFRLFLLLSVVFEIFLSTWMKYEFGFNTPVYSIFYILCVSYYLFVFALHHFKGKQRNVILFFLLPCWFFISLLNFFYFEGVFALNRISYIVGAFLNIGVVIWYYYSLLRNISIENLLVQPLFILSIGVLLLYACGFPIIFHLDSILALDHDTALYIFDFLLFGNLLLSLSYLYISLCPILAKRFLTN